jgi:Xaa-Pro dipeptidase
MIFLHQEALMFSRRNFLQASSLAAGATIALPTRSQAAEDEKPLPPAIAALQSRRTEAKPITVEERTERQEKARRLMADNNLAAILIAPGTSLAYFTGIHWEGGERLFAMVLPAKGDAFYVSPPSKKPEPASKSRKLPTEIIPTSASGKKMKAPTPA